MYGDEIEYFEEVSDDDYDEFDSVSNCDLFDVCFNSNFDTTKHLLLGLSSDELLDQLTPSAAFEKLTSAIEQLAKNTADSTTKVLSMLEKFFTDAKIEKGEYDQLKDQIQSDASLINTIDKLCKSFKETRIKHRGQANWKSGDVKA